MNRKLGKMVNKITSKIVFLCIFLCLGCKKKINPDEGLKFRLSLSELSIGQLEQYNYSELVKNSGAYVRHYNDTIVVYEYENGLFKRRHAMFKYYGDTATRSFSELFRNKGFLMVKVLHSNKNKLFLVKDLKYKKEYYVRFSPLKNVDFSYPDTIDTN